VIETQKTDAESDNSPPTIPPQLAEQLARIIARALVADCLDGRSADRWGRDRGER